LLEEWPIEMACAEQLFKLLLDGNKNLKSLSNPEIWIKIK